MAEFRRKVTRKRGLECGAETHLLRSVFLPSNDGSVGLEIAGRWHTGLVVHKAVVFEAVVREVLGVLEPDLWTFWGVQLEGADVGALCRFLVLLVLLLGVLEDKDLCRLDPSCDSYGSFFVLCVLKDKDSCNG